MTTVKSETQAVVDETSGSEESEAEGEAQVIDESQLEELGATGQSSFSSLKDITQQEFTESAPPVPVFKQSGLHSYIDALLIIRNARVTDRQITFQAPRRPIKNGEVYVYALQDGQSPHDWRFDGFQWHNLRANSFPKNKENPIITRHEFRLVDDGRKVDFYKHEYHEAGQKFKSEIRLEDWTYPFIVVHYYGNYPINEAHIADHGNRKTVGSRRNIGPSASRKFSRKGKKRSAEENTELLRSALRSITGELDDVDNSAFELGDDREESDVCIVNEDGGSNSPQKAKPSPQKKMRTGAEVEGLESYDGAIVQVYETVEIPGKPGTFDLTNGVKLGGPNFRKRAPLVPNSKYHKNLPLYDICRIPPLSKDDLYGCYIFQESMGSDKALRMLDFSNGTNIVIAENDFLKHVNTVVNSNVLQQPVKFNYQPTAKLYRFCVSTLFVQHPIFENEPNMPVAVFLHRAHNKESHNRFFNKIKELIPAMNTTLVDLTVNTENGVFPAAKEQLNENPKIKSVDPSSPRISSPKLDFVLVAVARHPNCDHVKLVHLVYFLQCHFLNEIARSLMGNCEGDLLIQSHLDSITCDTPSLAERLLPPGLQSIEDALGPPELINMLTRKPPVVMGSGSDYESCSKNELQMFEGLAHFFIAKDRVEWKKDRAVFSVRGLGGVEYIVKLNGRTCTCLREKACEHVLAVLIGTGLLARQS